MKRVCLNCPAVIAAGSRCSRCQSIYERDVRGSAAQRGYDSEWRKLVAEVLAEWRAVHGDLCPGLPGRIPPHPATDLTGDHIIAIADGGPVLPGRAGVGVLCTRCNSAKGGGQHGPPKSAGTRPPTQQARRGRPRQQPPQQTWVR